MRAAKLPTERMTGGGPSPEQVERFRTSLEALAGPAPGRLGLAVSGGPDSLALLLLAAAAFPGTVEAATVDHGLRPEAAEEAGFVGALCGRLSVPHQILHPTAPITGSVQAAARRIRYELLESWRRQRALDCVLTAHHAGDQAETLLMRLNRGSGLSGLSGVRARNRHVLRPLLGWHCSELDGIVRTAGIEAVDDPSNRDDRFDRTRIRRHLAEAEWIDQLALARSARALTEADEALEWALGPLEADRLRLRGASVLLDPAGLPSELRRRLVLRALRRIDPGAAPRGEDVSRLIDMLERGGTATLAGAKAAGGEEWEFTPAPPRRSG